MITLFYVCEHRQKSTDKACMNAQWKISEVDIGDSLHRTLCVEMAFHDDKYFDDDYAEIINV